MKFCRFFYIILLGHCLNNLARSCGKIGSCQFPQTQNILYLNRDIVSWYGSRLAPLTDVTDTVDVHCKHKQSADSVMTLSVKAWYILHTAYNLMVWISTHYVHWCFLHLGQLSGCKRERKKTWALHCIGFTLVKKCMHTIYI